MTRLEEYTTWDAVKTFEQKQQQEREREIMDQFGDNIESVRKECIQEVALHDFEQRTKKTITRIVQEYRTMLKQSGWIALSEADDIELLRAIITSM